jgi:hypothetical protein
LFENPQKTSGIESKVEVAVRQNFKSPLAGQLLGMDSLESRPSTVVNVQGKWHPGQSLPSIRKLN